MPQGTYAKRGKIIVNTTGLSYVKSPAGEIRKNNAEIDRQKGYKEEATDVSHRILNWYTRISGYEPDTTVEDSADRKIAALKKKNSDIKKYVKKVYD